jgi:hypothetical protein
VLEVVELPFARRVLEGSEEVSIVAREGGSWLKGLCVLE